MAVVQDLTPQARHVALDKAGRPVGLGRIESSEIEIQLSGE
jgi:hypothetical protein